VAKQVEAQERLKKELVSAKNPDKKSALAEAERERIRKEIEAHFQAQANEYVLEQIQ
jgi:hypothetical protein